MYNGVPKETKIAEAVRGLYMGRSGGLSGMRKDDLKGLLREAILRGKTGNVSVEQGGAADSVGLCGGVTSGINFLGNDGPPPERGGGYWDSGSGV